MGEQKARKELWMVEDREGDGEKKSFWTRIGVAFENKDGSYSLILAAFPVNGRIQMRDPLPPREDDDRGDARAPARHDNGGGPRGNARR